MALLKDYDLGDPFDATIVATERITPENTTEVRHIVIQLPKNSVRFVEGQSVGVLAPGPHAFGNEHHFRLYSVASAQTGENGQERTISICVRRCNYVDEYSGEEYKGVASNYLCDLRKDDRIRMTGPYTSHFTMPKDPSCNMLMIAMGTGIAPFRAFVKRIHNEVGKWKGKVRLFYGAERGIDQVYINDIKNDMSLYYDEGTFKAFEALSPRPALNEPIALEQTLEENAAEVWAMICDPKTYVYVSGLQVVATKLDAAMGRIAGGSAAWEAVKTKMHVEGRWSELIY